MTTTMTQQGIPAVEFPIKRPPPQYPVVGKYDAGRIIPHEPRYEPWMTDDIVDIDGACIWVRGQGIRNRGWDVTAEYAAAIDAAELADIDATQRGMVGQEGVG